MIPAVDRKRFFSAYRARWGRLTQAQVAGLEFLLGELEADPNITGIPQASYALATAKHESADTYQPIEEYGKGRGRKYGRPVEVTDAEGQKRTVTFFGRGYVQLTWLKNYETFAKLLGLDLVGRPELALEPETAYRVMSVGMAEGLFTGKKLGDYVNAHRRDFRNARRVINGTDRADHIAAIAEDFEEILAEATETAPARSAEADAPPSPASAEAGAPATGADGAPAATPSITVQEAGAVVSTAPVTPVEPVAGGGAGDPTQKVTSGSGSWARQVSAWIAALFASASSYAQQAFGLTPEIQRWLLVGVAVLGVVWLVCKLVGQWQVRELHADVTKVNVS